VVKNNVLDLLLINPPLSLDERYGRKVGRKVGGHLPPLGLAYLAGYVRNKGYTVKIIDGPASELSTNDIVEQIKSDKPKIVGITSLTTTFIRAINLAEEIKKNVPTTMVIVGGQHVTIVGGDIYKDTQAFDVMVYGEGELTLIEILENYKNGTFLQNRDRIKGLIYLDENQDVKTTPSRELIQDIDSLPMPAWDILPVEKYKPLPNNYKRLPALSVMTSRGCPFKCIFCSASSVFGKSIRMQSPQTIVNEIKYLIKNYGVKEISFWDDTFTVNRKRMVDFCNLMIKEKIDVVWTCYARVSSVDLELLKLMKKAGCWNVFYGYESGSQKLLDIIQKGVTLDEIRKVNAWTKEAGIEIRGSFMIALPGETPELAEETIKFAIELDPDYAQFSITAPYPGTVLYEEADQYGKLDANLSKYTGWEAVFVPHGYKNEEEIYKMAKHAFRAFYFRPRYILGRIKKIKSFEDIRRYFQGFKFIRGFTD
jgi:radical SAM superfamily enzyme YgiQ (UPF0313 family)